MMMVMSVYVWMDGMGGAQFNGGGLLVSLLTTVQASSAANLDTERRKGEIYVQGIWLQLVKRLIKQNPVLGV